MFCRKLGFQNTDKWREHEPNKLQEIKKQKMLWDFNFEIDRLREDRRADIVAVDEGLRKCTVIALHSHKMRKSI